MLLVQVKVATSLPLAARTNKNPLASCTTLDWILGNKKVNFNQMRLI
jgi:hypothetical protein